MSNEINARIETLNTRALPVRIGLAVLIIFAVLFGWFAVRWQLGNMLAELTSPADPNAPELAALSKSLAPADPLTNWLVANSVKRGANGENYQATIETLKETVRLSPFDYRWWVELARVYEQTGRTDLAEQAYLKAVELAPAYTYPHWQIGNFYLRQNRSDEAFAELKNAAQKNPIYRQQVFSIAWDFTDQNTALLEQIAGDLPEVKTGLAQFYATKGRAEDSLRIWNTLTEEEKKDNQAITRLVAQSLYDKQFYRAANGFVSSLGIEPDAKPETVQNGGFEDSISYTDYIYFGWRIAPTEKVEIKRDARQQREGAHSLQITFNGFQNQELSIVYQTIAVNPGANYTLSFRLRTENLKSAGTPILDVLNSKDSTLIVSSQPFPTGTNDWREIKMDFTAPADADAVFIRTGRVFCGDVCPLFGTIWYDDFKLVKR